MPLLTSITIPELKAYPVKRFKGKIHLIDNPKYVAAAVENLSHFRYLGFDTESKPVFLKGVVNENPISLVQLSTDNEAYLFRINVMGMPDELKKLLENENVLKIGSAISGDLSKIRKLTEPFEPKGFVDIQGIAKAQGIETVGLKRLTAILMGFRISKKHQLTNWDAEKLNMGQISYAATDAWACFKVYQDFIKRKFV